VTDPGLSQQESTVVARGRRAVLKPPSGSKANCGGGPGAKPPEADEFLQVKSVFSLNVR
jgi:hypothetical protein